MVSALASTLPPILVCRFMMNLRLIDDRGHATSGPDITSRLPSFGEPPVFMANMGEPLEYEDEAPWDDAVDIVNSDEGHSEDGSSS
ncbi:hypothetical protein PsYK624_011650 [Phanerochaete sordida]|uniref:Uncharacterized protein n=1 Tax=Phanerochaete sordida TaxID=48140 RepID=A0A9P3FYU2_9APHY|nr:hypothetical protein PsYK624_011650 [Phanerochaete sordida]